MQFSQMYGRYTKDLGEYAKDEARRLRLLERRRKKEDKSRNKVTITSPTVALVPHSDTLCKKATINLPLQS